MADESDQGALARVITAEYTSGDSGCTRSTTQKAAAATGRPMPYATHSGGVPLCAVHSAKVLAMMCKKVGLHCQVRR